MAVPASIRNSFLLAATILASALVGRALAADAPPAAVDTVKIEFDITVPQTTAADATVYLAGSSDALGAWKAAGVKADKKDDGHYHVTVALPKGQEVNYKITRGSWETVEKGPNGEEVANHTFTPNQDDTVKIEVAAWASGATTAPAQ